MAGSLKRSIGIQQAGANYCGLWMLFKKCDERFNRARRYKRITVKQEKILPFCYAHPLIVCGAEPNVPIIADQVNIREIPRNSLCASIRGSIIDYNNFRSDFQCCVEFPQAFQCDAAGVIADNDDADERRL